MSKRSVMADMKMAMGVLLALGVLVLALNMASNISFRQFGYENTKIMDRLGTATEKFWKTSSEETPRSLLTAQRVNMSTLFSAGLAPALEPCWSQLIQRQRPTGQRRHIVVKISNGPQNHRLQIAAAVVVAVQLNAILTIPTIKEGVREPGSKFEEIYSVRHFIAALEGVVRVVGRLPPGIDITKDDLVKIPFRVTPEYIDELLRPRLEERQVIVINSFTSASEVKYGEDAAMQAIRCLVMYHALQFAYPVQKLGERVVSRMKEAGLGFGGHFVAVDLRLDLLQQRECNSPDAYSSGISPMVKKKKCLSPLEVGLLLQNLGFDPNTAVYLTQSRWDKLLDPLSELFPNVHTKEYSMPFNEENQFLLTGTTQLELAVDFIVCTYSDVFVPAIPGMFYASVAGDRIAMGRTNIIVPTSKAASVASSPVLTGTTSKFVSKKDHPVYICFCNSTTVEGQVDAGL